MGYADNIKHRRSLLGISQQDLADISGVSLSTIKLIESQSLKANPSVATLQKLGDALGMELVFRVRGNQK